MTESNIFGITSVLLFAGVFFMFNLSMSDGSSAFTPIDETPITIGSAWIKVYRAAPGDPFGRETYPDILERAYVLDVKNGWVKYIWCDITKDGRCIVSSMDDYDSATENVFRMNKIKTNDINRIHVLNTRAKRNKDSFYQYMQKTPIQR